MTETQHQQPENFKKLYRSNEDKMITGLLGGVGEYFTIDATIVRLGVAFIAVVTGIVPGFIFYLLASWIVPKKDTIKKVI